MFTNPEIFLGTVLLDRYRLERLLETQGGQSTVYLATDLSTSIDNKRVIKQFSPKYKDNKTLEVGTLRFAKESEILQKLGKHSQIPRIFDYFELDKRFYLVQELVVGQNLTEEFAERKHLEELEVIDLLKNTLNVLNFVHKNGYIHRDIKPSNLIRNQCDRQIYLIDFGAVKEKINPENITQQNNIPTVVIGTPGYMPLEQLQGTPKFCSDIYALGMVAIGALTGSHPIKFVPKNYKENPFWQDRLPTTTKPYNTNFLNLLDRMVRTDNLERYQSVDEVLKDLERINQNQPEREIVPLSRSIPSTVKSIPSTAIGKPAKPLFPWLIAAFCAVVAIALGSFKINNSQKYVSYSNSEYGIELEYPESWKVEEKWMTLEPEVTFLSLLANKRDFREQVTVSVEKLASPLTLNEYTAQATAQIENSNTILEPPIPITFARKEGRKIVYQTKDKRRKLLEVWTIKNHQVYIATYTAETDKFDRYSQSAEKMIQSLIVNNR